MPYLQVSSSSIFLRKIHRFMTERLSCVATVWCQLHVTFRYQTACHSRRIWEPGHRAAVGVSEVSDSLTIIVSEETGSVSTAYKGQIEHDIDADHLRTQLKLLQNRHREPGKFELIKRRFKNGKEASKNLHK